MLVVYGDASRELGNLRESGFGGWCIIGNTFHYIEGRWSEGEMLRHSINVLEHHTTDILTGTMLDMVAARIAAGEPLAPVTHVHEFTDNTGAEHSSERGKPASGQMHAIVARRYAENLERRVFTHTERVTSLDNDVADGLSRGGAMQDNSLRMMASLGLRIQRVPVEPWRRSMNWLRNA